tara:strand:+ start:475 stop:1683 length:1209 start_codon:yes stop_codon:yes gene_type:complete
VVVTKTAEYTFLKVVGEGNTPFFKYFFRLLITVNFYLFSHLVSAATLAPDTVDAVYHSYDGGGMDINGPFILVRKSIGTDFSVNGHYYIDSVSSASIDVVANASEYEEERTEYSLGFDYLHDKTIVSSGFTNSTENDFEANSGFLSISQSFFGDLTTLSLAYVKGKDDVGKINNDFSEKAERDIYKVGISQILTKNSLLGFNLEMITDEGYLNNPYRSYRFLLDESNPSLGYGTATEVYPTTRTSYAVATRVLYYLPYRASIKAEYRFFNDSWGITANTYEVAYVHPLTPRWTVEGRYRYYSQSQADFYKDLFPFQNAETYMGRDKELSRFSDFTLGGGISYEFGQGVIPHVNKMKFTALVDYMKFTYDNFRNVTEPSLIPGEEPLYEFDAWVTRLAFTFEY